LKLKLKTVIPVRFSERIEKFTPFPALATSKNAAKANAIQ